MKDILDSLYKNHINNLRQTHYDDLGAEKDSKNLSVINALEQICESTIFDSTGIDVKIKLKAELSDGNPSKYVLISGRASCDKNFVKCEYKNCSYKYRGFSYEDSDTIFECMISMQEILDNSFIEACIEMKRSGLYYLGKEWHDAIDKFLAKRKKHLRNLFVSDIDDLSYELDWAKVCYNIDTCDLEIALENSICDMLDALGLVNIAVHVKLQIPVNYWSKYLFDEIPYTDITELDLAKNRDMSIYHYRWVGDSLIRTTNKKTTTNILSNEEQIYVDRMLEQAMRLFHRKLERMDYD